MTTYSWSHDRAHAPLSDAVIGSVLTRARGPGYGGIKACRHSSLETTRHQQFPYSSAPSRPLPSIKSLSPLGCSTTSAPEPTDHLVPPSPAQVFHQRANKARNCVPNYHHQVSASSSRPSIDIQSPNSTSRVVSTAVSRLTINPTDDWSPNRFRKRRASFKSEATREQCRTNQARYRQKQREYVSTLEGTVAQLRDEIPMLEVQRRRLQYDSQQRAWDVVAEYFQLFRSGVGNATEQRPTGTNEVLCTTEAQQQLMFLRSTMASNVEFGRGDLIGVEALMGHWQRLSECHDGLHVQMEYLNKISDTIVIATATMSVTITKNTLEGIFPHLMGSESVEDLSLAVRLLGHRLSYPCSTLFVWDEASSLVVRLETDVDMATPLLKLLGNLDEVSRVLDGAVVFAQHDTC